VRSFSRENHVRDGIGHVISIFDGSVKSQKPEQRVGLEAFMPNFWTMVEANILLTIKISGPTGAVIYRPRRMEPEVMGE
jgi:hypothetical protein